VFARIVEGIEEQAKGPVTRVPVGPNVIAQDLADDLRRRDIRVVIALGRNGLKIASELGSTFGIVAGGVLSVPESETRGFPVHSLTPDPVLLFARLKRFMPGARRVFVVYDPRHNGWLIRLAREAARSNGLELVAHEAADLQGAIRHYQQILASSDARRDALWLPQDATTVEESAVLPLVLKEAWDRNFGVFSSNVAHVKRGALFALYPDNLGLGRRLAQSALGYLATGRPVAEGVLPLREVLIAVNSRTAAHLGVKLDASLSSYDMVFPEP